MPRRPQQPGAAGMLGAARGQDRVSGMTRCTVEFVAGRGLTTRRRLAAARADSLAPAWLMGSRSASRIPALSGWLSSGPSGRITITDALMRWPCSSYGCFAAPG